MAQFLTFIPGGFLSLRLIILSLIGIIPGILPLQGQSKVVFSENFDNATSLQPWAPYYSTGWINKSTNTLQSVSGRGKVFHVNFAANTVGSDHGLGNYRIPLDSAYKELYLSWEYFVPANFDFGFADGLGGGKFFGGFSGGSMTAIPNSDATDVDGWVSILMFQNGYYSTYNYFKGSSFSSGGWPLGVKVANISKGQWRRTTIRMKINDGDQANGLFEVFDNDVLVYQLPNTKIVNSAHPEYLIEHIYLNSFFGGSGAQYVSPISQYMEFDNIVAFYYPKGTSGYRSGSSELGRVIQVPQATSYHPVPPNKFTPATYTQASGTINSHCGYYQPSDHVESLETSVIQVAGATSLNINVTKFNYDGGVSYAGYKQILKIYQGTGTSKVLKKTLQNGIGTALCNVAISGNSATIEWQAGQGTHNGFTLSYSSNGTGSGNNFACSSCIAEQPTSIPPTSLPTAPSALTYSDLTDRSVILKWTDNCSRETGFEIERKNPDGSVQILQSGANTTSYPISGLIDNTVYTCRVRSVNTAGSSVYSNTIQLTTNYALPTPPSNLVSTGKTSNSVSLAWTDNSGIEDGFKIERSLSSTTGFTEVGTVGANVTNYTNGSCSSSTTYYFRVSAYNPAGSNVCTTILAVTTPAAASVPAAPSALTYSSLTDRSLTLNWTDHANNETSFEIERTDPDNKVTKYSSASNTTSLPVAGLIGNTTYRFRIRSYNAQGYSVFSNTLQIKTNYALPTAPSALSNNGVTANTINLKWTDNSGIEDGFKIERSLSSTTGFTEVGTVGANVTNYTNGSCSSSTTYYFRVRAYNPAGNTAYTPVLAVTTSGSVTPPVGGTPAAPTSLTLTAQTSSTISLRWTDNSNNESGFIIERSLYPTTGFAPMSNVAANITLYTNTTLRSNATYYYRVCANNASGKSGYTTILGAKTLSASIATNTFDTLSTGYNDVTTVLTQSTMALYPNPSSGVVNITIFAGNDLSGFTSEGQLPLTIVNIMGSTVYSKFINFTGSSEYQENMDLSELPGGLYFVILQRGNQFIKEKLIISK